MAEEQTNLEKLYQLKDNFNIVLNMAKERKKKEMTKEEDLRPVSLDEFTEHIKENLEPIKPKVKKKPKTD